MHGFASKKRKIRAKGGEDSEEGAEKMEARTKFLEKERDRERERNCHRESDARRWNFLFLLSRYSLLYTSAPFPLPFPLWSLLI